MTNADVIIALPSSPEQSLNSKAFINSISHDMAIQMECNVSSVAKFNIRGHGRPGRQTIGRELEHRLQLFIQQQVSLDADGDTDLEHSFFIADLGEVYRQFIRWKRNLPRIEPFYAVKCNPDPKVLRLLAFLGVGFDCASKDEIAKVLDLTPIVPRRNIIFAN